MTSMKWRWIPKTKKYGNVRVKVEKTICIGRGERRDFSDSFPSRPASTAVQSGPLADTWVGRSESKNERESSGDLDGDVNFQLKPK